MILGRQFQYDRALEIIQDEEYLEDADFDDVRRNDILKKMGKVDPNFNIPKKHQQKILAPSHGDQNQKYLGKYAQGNLNEFYSGKYSKYHLNYAKGKIYGSISLNMIFNSILGKFFQSKFPQAGFFILNPFTE